MSLKRTVGAIFLIIFFKLISCFTFVPLYQLEGRIAKTRFCSQKYFDSLSFDGESYKFSVNRKVVNYALNTSRYMLEVFKLKYDHQIDSFVYRSTTFDNHNVVLLGGIYIDQLNVYIEFYKNLSLNVDSTKRIQFCPYYNIPIFDRYNCTKNCNRSNIPFTSEPQTILNLCDWRYLNQPCLKTDSLGKTLFSVRPSIFNQEVIKHLEKGIPCTFVYEPKSEKIIYIFSDKANPFVVNSLRTISSTNGVNWFNKDIRKYKIHKFAGTFKWPAMRGNVSTIYLMAHTNWTHHNTTLFKLINTKEFVLSPESTTLHTFFGCQYQRKHSTEQLRSLQKSTSPALLDNAFNVCIIVLGVLTAAIALFAFARHINFITNFKDLFKRVCLKVCF